MQLKNPAFGEAAEQRLADAHRVETGELRKSQCLGHRVDCLGDNELIGEFSHLSAAGGAEMGDLFPDRL